MYKLIATYDMGDEPNKVVEYQSDYRDDLIFDAGRLFQQSSEDESDDLLSLDLTSPYKDTRTLYDAELQDRSEFQMLGIVRKKGSN